MVVTVLRLNHRISRDKRLTTHVFLTARAFGGSKIFYSGERDNVLEESIGRVVDQFGGSFSSEYVKSPLSFVKNFNGVKIHLTMYGLSYKKVIEELHEKDEQSILVIVGASKVRSEFFEVCDFNVGVGNQPHSEVAALSIFLHDFFKGEELNKSFVNAKKKIIPSKSSKNVKDLS